MLTVRLLSHCADVTQETCSTFHHILHHVREPCRLQETKHFLAPTFDNDITHAVQLPLCRHWQCVGANNSLQYRHSGMHAIPTCPTLSTSNPTPTQATGAAAHVAATRHCSCHAPTRCTVTRTVSESVLLKTVLRRLGKLSCRARRPRGRRGGRCGHRVGTPPPRCA